MKQQNPLPAAPKYMFIWWQGWGEDQKPLNAERLFGITGLGLLTTCWASLTFSFHALLLISSICSAALDISVAFTLLLLQGGLLSLLLAQEPWQLLLGVIKVQPVAPGLPTGLPVGQASHI